MSKHLVLLPGWGLGVAPLQILAEQLEAALPQMTVQIQPLPDVRGKNAEAVIALLDQQLPSDCWLMGWSLGGMLATALAAQRQSTCAGLISYASNACFVARDSWPTAMPVDTFTAFRQLCAEDLTAGLKRFVLLCSQGTAQPRALARQLSAAAAVADSASALAGLDLLAALDNRDAISAFSGPQLHLLAEQDALVPSLALSHVRELNSKVTVELFGHSHAGLIVESQVLAQRIAAFIRGSEHA